jgi:hypothetical protein
VDSSSFLGTSCIMNGYRVMGVSVCHNSVNVSGNVIMLVEMAMVMLVVQCSQ